MNYRFYLKDEKAQVGIKLVFESDDFPMLQRWGAAEDFKDIDIPKLDELVYDLVETERKQAESIRRILKDKKLVNQHLEASLISLRAQTRRLFDEMCENKEDLVRLKELNAEMQAVTEKGKNLRKAFSVINPWCQHYVDLQMPDEAKKAVEQIIVKANITDKTWAKNPVYPPERPKRRKGMTMDEVCCLRGSTVMLDPDYRWPDMELSYVAVPRYVLYRDLLPKAWLSTFPGH